jgi:hypothetical protein
MAQAAQASGKGNSCFRRSAIASTFRHSSSNSSHVKSLFASFVSGNSPALRGTTPDDLSAIAVVSPGRPRSGRRRPTQARNPSRSESPQYQY